MTHTRKDALNPRPRTVDQVRESLQAARKQGDAGADLSFAKLMVRHGNLTDEARAFARQYLAKNTHGS